MGRHGRFCRSGGTLPDLSLRKSVKDGFQGSNGDRRHWRDMATCHTDGLCRGGTLTQGTGPGLDQKG